MSIMHPSGNLNRSLEWFWRFFYINLLWIGFILAGLIVMGFAPATAALFSVTRKWLIGQKDIAIFSSFVNTFKESFMQINLIFYLALICGYSLYFYGNFVQLLEGFVYVVISAVWICLIMLFLIIILYIFPVYVHFDMTTFNYIKYALLIGISAPWQTVLLLTSAVTTYTLFLAIPTIIPFFFGSVLSFILMWISLHAFRKLERKNTSSSSP